MKRTVLRVLLILVALGSAECSLRPESRFFSNFNADLDERGKVAE